MLYGFQVLCEISKVPFEISYKIWNPYTAKYAFCEVLNVDIWYGICSLFSVLLRVSVQVLAWAFFWCPFIWQSHIEFSTLIKHMFERGYNIFRNNDNPFIIVVHASLEPFMRFRECVQLSYAKYLDNSVLENMIFGHLFALLGLCERNPHVCWRF